MITFLLRSFLLILFFAPLMSMGQDVSFGLEARTNIPLKDFKQQLHANSFPELAAFGYYEFPGMPIAAGLSVGYGLYGSVLEKRNDLYDGDTEVYRIRRNNNILNIKVHYRHYLPWVKYEKLFFDAQLGLGHMYTRFLIRENLFSETIEEGLDHGTYTMVFGFGLGYKLPITFKNEGTHLELKAIYNNSNPTRFLPKGAVNTTKNPGEDAVFNYNIQKASLQMFQIAIAIVGLNGTF
tara:strand:+ start:58299 stop:59009 length:711 start_codon:yes stop_codon:yes gene_type:complete